MWGEAAIIAGLIAANGLFSGAEIAVLSVRRTRLRELVEAGRPGARAVELLRAQPERFLATVQVAITVVSAAAAAYSGDVFAERLAAVFAKFPSIAHHARQLALFTVVGAISYLSVVFGELVPKSLALRAAEVYSLLIGALLVGLSQVARPIVFFLTASSNLILRIFGDRTSFSEARLSPDELQEMVEEAAKTGSLDRRTSEIASRAIEFRNLTAASVMVPRVSVAALPKEATLEQVRSLLHGRLYTRIPIYEGNIDNVIGYIATKDVLDLLLRGAKVDLPALIRPVHIVPGTRKASDLLHDMQKRRGSIAIVVDEQGGLLGLVTIEDLIEELVGEIFSEHDSAHESIKREPAGTALVQGTAPVREVNWALDLELPESNEWYTIAGLCIALAEQIPQEGQRLNAPDGSVIEIVEATPRRIRTVRVHPPAKPAPAATPT